MTKYGGCPRSLVTNETNYYTANEQTNCGNYGKMESGLHTVFSPFKPIRHTSIDQGIISCAKHIKTVTDFLPYFL